MKSSSTPTTPSLRIQRVTVRTALKAGRELTPRCSPHNDCSTITG